MKKPKNMHSGGDVYCKFYNKLAACLLVCLKGGEKPTDGSTLRVIFWLRSRYDHSTVGLERRTSSGRSRLRAPDKEESSFISQRVKDFKRVRTVYCLFSRSNRVSRMPLLQPFDEIKFSDWWLSCTVCKQRANTREWRLSIECQQTAHYKLARSETLHLNSEPVVLRCSNQQEPARCYKLITKRISKSCG